MVLSDVWVWKALPYEILHATSSVKNRTAPDLYKMRLQHLKILPPVPIETLARRFTDYVSKCYARSQWEITLLQKGDVLNTGNYCLVCTLLTSRTFLHNILDKIVRPLDEQPRLQTMFRKLSGIIHHTDTITRFMKLL
ncbi:hypothetical protein DICVIV_09112 [Dictyocaulus viviparus]|uniref:Uncharacterized protein n=1 Tax=Dictyocaulus viviparus TaxID=29172 RepID=A0A0D8XM93_DICVI|nr:hypothetical protein DICVIV_09112 [Dictyocaulus viviparus]